MLLVFCKEESNDMKIWYDHPADASVPDGSVSQISMGPSHDQQVIHKLFTNGPSAAKVLQDSDPLLPSIDSALKDLALPEIGSDERLMEWREKFKEREPTHRLVSHLYMLHPGNMTDPKKTPELADAVRKSLEARIDIATEAGKEYKTNNDFIIL